MRAASWTASVSRGLREDRDELVTAEAADRVAAANAVAQRPADLGEHLVAVQMAVLVVDALEVVEVDEADREAEAAAGAAVDLAVELVASARVAETAGQGIERSGLQQRYQQVLLVQAQRHHRGARLGGPHRQSGIGGARRERRDQGAGRSRGQPDGGGDGVRQAQPTRRRDQRGVVIVMQGSEDRALGPQRAVDEPSFLAADVSLVCGTQAPRADHRRRLSLVLGPAKEGDLAAAGCRRRCRSAVEALPMRRPERRGAPRTPRAAAPALCALDLRALKTWVALLVRAALLDLQHHQGRRCGRFGRAV